MISVNAAAVLVNAAAVLGTLNRVQCQNKVRTTRYTGDALPYSGASGALVRYSCNGLPSVTSTKDHEVRRLDGKEKSKQASSELVGWIRIRLSMKVNRGTSFAFLRALEAPKNDSWFGPMSLRVEAKPPHIITWPQTVFQLSRFTGVQRGENSTSSVRKRQMRSNLV